MSVVSGMTVKLVTAYEDGSGWTALVNHYGSEFSVHYTAGEVKVFGTANVSHKAAWKLKASVKALTAWAKAEVAALGADWAAKHAAMYDLKGGA